MKLIIYLPAFNEEADIQQVIANLPREIDQISCIEFLVVDDGSTDRTAEIAQACGAQVVRHGRNRGVGSAFHSAAQYALENAADILVSIDADGQFDCNEIHDLIQPIVTKRAHLVVGNRFRSGRPTFMPRVKYYGNQVMARLINSISGQNLTDVSCGFRALDREALLRLNIFGQFTYTHETILSLVYQGLTVVEYPIHVSYDPQRKSRVARSVVGYGIQTLKIIARVMLDYRPMRVFGTLGSLFVLIGMLLEAGLFGYYALAHSFTPYKSLGFIGLGFIVFGMLVLLIALLADMLNRLRMNQDRLLYESRKMRYQK